MKARFPTSLTPPRRPSTTIDVKSVLLGVLIAFVVLQAQRQRSPGAGVAADGQQTGAAISGAAAAVSKGAGAAVRLARSMAADVPVVQTLAQADDAAGMQGSGALSVAVSCTHARPCA